MERLPIELLYILGFVAVVLLNHLAQRRARGPQQEEAHPPEPPVSGTASSPSAHVGDDTWGRSPPRAPAAAVPVTRPAPASPPPWPRRMHPARALLNDKRELRRAVVLAMILGPCRAQEPPGR
jgi:hypothetical protein